MQQCILRISWEKSTTHRLKHVIWHQLCCPLAAKSNERPRRVSAKSTWAAEGREAWQVLTQHPPSTNFPLCLHPPPAPRASLPVQHDKENTVLTLRQEPEAKCWHTPSVSHLSLPPAVTGQGEWSRQAVTAAPTPLAPLHSSRGTAGILNKAATDCKGIRARGRSGISRGSDTGMVTRDPLAPDWLQDSCK